MWEPATGIEHQMRDALRSGRQDDYFRLLAGMELLLPISEDRSDYSTEPDTWATWSTDERTHVLAFTSEASLRACLKAHAGPYRVASFPTLSDTWPDEDWWLAVNPGLPIEGYLPSWFVTQVAHGDTTLPDSEPSDTATPAHSNAPDWRADAEAAGWPSSQQAASAARAAPSDFANRGVPATDDFPPLPAGPSDFSSNSRADSYSALPTRRPAAASQAEADDGYGWSDLPEEQPRYGAASPGYEPQRMDAAPAIPEPVADDPWLDESDAENQLAASAASGDTETFLHAMMRSWAYLPVGDRAVSGSRPGTPGFDWYTDLIDGAYTVTAFTSPVRLEARYGSRRWIKTTFARLASEWPGLEYSLYVNPETEVGANMAGPQVTTLLTWARTKGLVALAETMDRRAEAETVSDLALQSPVWLQKAVPHQQVKLILERGYDRVAGFVHKYDDVSVLSTPSELYRALGLLRADSRFAQDDTELHVLRWVGYCPALYRVAYGANDEAALASSGGWVVEPAPFTGTGTAPGDDRIPEYKVDSVRLPHGARIYRIGADGANEEVASYDADRREWVRNSFGHGGAAWDVESSRSQEQQHA